MVETVTTRLASAATPSDVDNAMARPIMAVAALFVYCFTCVSTFVAMSVTRSAAHASLLQRIHEGDPLDDERSPALRPEEVRRSTRERVRWNLFKMPKTGLAYFLLTWHVA